MSLPYILSAPSPRRSRHPPYSHSNAVHRRVDYVGASSSAWARASVMQRRLELGVAEDMVMSLPYILSAPSPRRSRHPPYSHSNAVHRRVDYVGASSSAWARASVMQRRLELGVAEDMVMSLPYILSAPSPRRSRHPPYSHSNAVHRRVDYVGASSSAWARASVMQRRLELPRTWLCRSHTFCMGCHKLSARLIISLTVSTFCQI